MPCIHTRLTYLGCNFSTTKFFLLIFVFPVQSQLGYMVSIFYTLSKVLECYVDNNISSSTRMTFLD